MKKTLFITMAVILMAFPCSAFDGAQGSAQLTEDGAAVTGSNVYITGLTIFSDGTNDATVVLYDNATAASGTVVATLYVPGALKANRMNWTYPRKVSAGIYADLTGTGAKCVVDYVRK